MPAPALKFSRFFRIWLCGEHRVVQAMPFCAASQTNIKCPDEDSAISHHVIYIFLFFYPSHSLLVSVSVTPSSSVGSSGGSSSGSSTSSD